MRRNSISHMAGNVFGFVLLTSLFVSMAAAQLSEPLQRPKLLGMAYALPDEAEDLDGLTIFDAKGKAISKELLKRITSATEAEDFKYPSHVVERAEKLTPIVMVFDVDTRLTDSGVVAYLTNDGVELPSRSWTFGSNDGILTSFILPPDDWQQWPENTEVKIRFADKNPEVVDTFEGELKERVNLVDGCFLDLSSLGFVRFGSPKTDRTVYFIPQLQTEDGQSIELNTFEVQVNNGIDYICRVSGHLPSTNIKMELLEKTFSYETIGEIVLPPSK